MGRSIFNPTTTLVSSLETVIRHATNEIYRQIHTEINFFGEVLNIRREDICYRWQDNSIPLHVNPYFFFLDKSTATTPSTTNTLKPEVEVNFFFRRDQPKMDKTPQLVSPKKHGLLLHAKPLNRLYTTTANGLPAVVALLCSGGE